MKLKDLQKFILIIIIFIAACIETDIYLPAFTDMMAFFQVSEAEIQKVLTWNFFGLFVSSLAYGPLSDAWGRRKPLLIALGLFLIGSIVTVLADSFNWMLWGRVLQGLGSGGVFTLGSAIIFDIYPGEKAVHALNRINSIVPFLMASAPLLGGYLNSVYGFRSNFTTIAALVGLSFVSCCFYFDESLDSSKRVPFQLKNILCDFKQVGTSLAFWQLTLTVSLLFAGYLVFLSGSAVFFVLELGVRKEVFPYYQGVVLGGYFFGSLSCSRAIAKWGMSKVKRTGTILVVAGAVGLAIVSAFASKNPFLLTLVMVPYSFGFLWTQTPYLGELMEIFPNKKGIAASLLTSARLLLTAGAVGVASKYYNGTVYPYFITILVIMGVIGLSVFTYEHKRRLRLDSNG